MENFVVVIVFFVSGMLLKRFSSFPQSTGQVLNLFVVYLSLPALILLKMPQVSFSEKLMIPFFVSWGMILTMAGVIVGLAAFFKWSQKVTGCFLLVIPLGNTSFLGIPIIEALIGDKGIPFALIYDQLGSFLALSTYGALILAIYGTGEKRSPLKEMISMDMIQKMLRFPPLIALILSLLLKSVEYPKYMVAVLTPLSGTLVPLVMVAVGFQLKLRLASSHATLFLTGLFLKLILAPLLALFFCYLFNLKGLAATVSVLMTGMPPMVTAGALAIQADLSADLSAALVGYGLMVSLFTLPLLCSLLNGL